MLRQNNQNPKPYIFYHVTHPDNIEAIERDGLVANPDGHIFAFTDMLVAETIAAQQLFLREYAVFAVRGCDIEGEVQPDNVAELSSSFHRIILQDRIEPESLVYLGTHTVDPKKRTPWTYAQWTFMGHDRESAERVIEMIEAAIASQEGVKQ